MIAGDVLAVAQRDFARALLDPDRPPPAGLTAWNGSDVGPRLDVHRNNVVLSLVGVLADTFPVVRRIVGDAVFVALASRFVRAQPPTSPVLTDYGDGFPDGLAAFAPPADRPYLPDVARLERARVRAYHAADAEPLATAALAATLAEPDHLPDLRLRLHPSLTVLRSPHAVVSLWAAHQHGDAAEAIASMAARRPEFALVLRDGDDVLVHPLPAAAADLVAALQRGAPLGDAAAGCAADELAATFALLVRHGAIVAVADGGAR